MIWLPGELQIGYEKTRWIRMHVLDITAVFRFCGCSVLLNIELQQI